MLRVPDFDRLNGDLLYSAVTGGANDEAIATYLDSILDMAGDGERLNELRRHRSATGAYPTTEAAILEDYPPAPPADGHLSEAEGLRLILEACEELEAQVSRLSRSQDQKEEPADVS
jgi:hypothetical protein